MATTTQFYANDGGSGFLTCISETWANLKGTPATAGYVEAKSSQIFGGKEVCYVQTYTSGGTYSGARVYWAFTTSDIGTDDITSASLNIYYSTALAKAEVNAGSVDYYIYQSTQGDVLNGNSTTDWIAYSGSKLATFLYEDFGTTDGVKITQSLSNTTFINKTGNSYLCALPSGMIDDVTPTGNNYVTVYSEDHTGTTYDPYLEVTYAAVATGTNMQLNIGDTWKDITKLQINIGDSWKEVTKAQINIGDTWKEIF